jgi:hypothetical protein
LWRAAALQSRSRNDVLANGHQAMAIAMEPLLLGYGYAPCLRAPVQRAHAGGGFPQMAIGMTHPSHTADVWTMHGDPQK